MIATFFRSLILTTDQNVVGQ